MDDVVITLGKRIRQLRLRTGLSQEKLADKAGMDRTYSAGIERGERNPSVKESREDPVGIGRAAAGIIR
jgi:DNA-binding XRE family transcriptional regulator